MNPESEKGEATNKAPLLLLAGPTAVGKSEVALILAERLGGEIVSVDSMQVYRGLDIGTGKPSPAERARVPHHLIDVAELGEAFDAAQFVRQAGAAVEGIRSRGHLPILCGGTGLYFRAYLEGLGPAPPADPELRAQLEGTSLAELLRELAESDPVVWQSIDRQNPRRVIRALEVIRLTGRPFSEQRSDWKQGHAAPESNEGGIRNPEHAPLFSALRRSTEDLRQRIEQRVEAMFRQGLVAETRELLQRGLNENRTAMQALGYRQVCEHLRGERSLPATIELVKTRTRQYAKRQMTWFQKQASATWIEVAPRESAEQTAERLLSLAAPNLAKRLERGARPLDRG